MKENLAACKAGLRRFALSEQGDIVSALGWMAIMALVLVALKKIIDEGLINYAQEVFFQLDRIFSTGK
ncbi:MAG: hypothetical protein VB085_04075 [Peptococcaceae bacterium]|nr:hypothetical protein [Peptococcaceae bacterium]